MLYREFGTTGWNISTIGMGTWNIGNQWGNIEEDVALATVRSAFENGVNLFDTAEGYGIPYGLSEERLGKALKGIRDRVHIVTKIGSWGRRTGEGLPKNVDNIRLCLQAALFRMRTDWADAVLCHEGDIEDPTVYLEAFEQMKEKGYLRAYGISTNDFEVLKRFNANKTCSIVEFDYSLLNRKAESHMLPYCLDHGIAVLVRGPLGQGLLSGKYGKETIFTDTIRAKWHKNESKQAKLKQNIEAVTALQSYLKPSEDMATTALRYVISHSAHPVAIPGAKSPQQAAMNAQAGDRLLSHQERETLLQNLSTEKREGIPVGQPVTHIYP
ncbi:MAG: aldo/keto reductase [Acaryochloris sp. RU_4_1]|nr:aldo/keto reductase [Acaryochloris sp. RU_4_1]NJN38706.1 aldo/keto reductase [Acaryochloridaceae cyanobacterium CSU_3_4]NJR54178.1 aldo/keto reductase [Acaryochloris sp. CRU_2_0]